MTRYQVHIIHGTGPLGSVCQCEGHIACRHQLITCRFQLINRLRNFNSHFRENSLVIENITSGQSAERYGKNFSVIGSLRHRRIDKVGMVIGIKHIRDIIYETGFVVFCHRAAAPVDIHIRRLLGAHRHHQLLFVIIILLMHQINGDIGVVIHKSLYCPFHCGLAGIFR